MAKDRKPRVYRIFGRSYAYNSVASDDKSTRAHICGNFVAVTSSERLAYLHVPRDPCNPSNLSLPYKHDITSYENFAEPQKGKLRSKAVVSLAISGDGAWLACGEQGQAPLLCIWSLPLRDEQPRFILNVHRFGIKFLAFSSDSRYLASLGYMHDAGIHIWDLQDGCRMIFTNRVNAKVHDLKWMGSNRIITCGVRHVKVWHFSTTDTECNLEYSKLQTSPKVLDGRNVILGPFVHSEFSSICIDIHNKVYLATSHEVCIYSSAGIGSLTQVYHTSTAIQRISITDEFLSMRLVDESLHFLHLVTSKDNGDCHKVATNELQEVYEDYNADLAPDSRISLRGASSVLECFTSREQSIVFTSDCEAMYFDKAGCLSRRGIPRRRPVTAIVAISTDLLILGTASGQVILYDHVQNIEWDFEIAHSSEVIFLKYDHSTKLVATCGRDRTIQLFSVNSDTDPKLELYQTLDEHTGNVTDVLFLPNEQLISSSSDRTVVIRRPVADDKSAANSHYVVCRTLDFKSACFSMTHIGISIILCSFADKSLVQIDTCSANVHEVCKTEDTYDKMAATSNGILACVASQDKSIAFRSVNSGDLLCESTYGHIDRITSLKWCDYDNISIAQTTSTDGLVIQWLCDREEIAVPKPSPVRKVIRKDQTLLSPVKTNLRTSLRRHSSLTGRQTPTERPRTPSKLARDASGSPSYANPTSIASSRASAADTKIMVSKTVAQLKSLQLKSLNSDQIKDLQAASSWLKQHQ